MCSISNMFTTARIPSFAEFSRKEIYSFWKRVENSDNLIVKSLAGTWQKFQDLYTYSRWHKALYGVDIAVT